VAADLGDPCSPQLIMERADRRFGVVHGLVNAAVSTHRGNVCDSWLAGQSVQGAGDAPEPTLREVPQ
jgi:hypothetical protein